MSRFIIILILTIIFHSACGQVESAVVWSVSQATDLRTGFPMDYRAKFIVRGDTVMWKQKNVSMDYSFHISAVSGPWEDLDRNKKVILQVSFRGRNGTMEFSGDATARQLRIRMELGEQDLLPYMFTISSMQKI